MSFEQLSDNFINSLVSNDADLKLDKFSIHDYRVQKQGRGLIALQDIEEDEVLFSIPRELILNIETCSMTAEQKAILNTLGQWEALILIILYEKSIGADSKWFDYFQVLPNESFNNLMFWSEEELSMLKPSLVLERIGADKAEAMYTRLFPDAIKELGLEEKLGNVTQEEFHKVASTIMSYSFDVEHPVAAGEESGDEDELEVDEDEDDEDAENETNVMEEGYYKSMVPLADTLNADTKLCNANLEYNPEALVMKSTQRITKGSQIYNTYANHPNAEILRRYGYVEFDGSKHDFGELKLDSIIEFFKLKYDFAPKLMNNIVELITDNEYLLELTEGQNIMIDTYDCYHTDGEVYPELILLLQILTVLGLVNQYQQDKRWLKRLSKTELEKFLNRNIKKNYQLVEQNKLMNSTVENFHEILQQRISEYPEIATTSDDSEQDYTNRPAMAKCVLRSELNSLKASKEKALQKFEIIDDDKMMKNIMKRKMEEDEAKADKKRRK